MIQSQQQIYPKVGYDLLNVGQMNRVGQSIDQMALPMDKIGQSMNQMRRSIMQMMYMVYQIYPVMDRVSLAKHRVQYLFLRAVCRMDRVTCLIDFLRLVINPGAWLMDQVIPLVHQAHQLIKQLARMCIQIGGVKP